MKKNIAALGLSIAASCTTYSVPRAPTMVGVTLTTADVEFVSQASGNGSAWAIFPFWLFMATPLRAEDEALWNADQTAYEQGRADFVMNPRVKVVYRNWLLFDYASAEVQGKAVRIK